MPLAVVVEDEWSIRMQMADMLSDAGWEVVEFASGEQAVAFLTQGRNVDCLVTDIRLTGAVTGWDVAQAYRASNPGLRVVYCSGNPLNPERQVENSQFFSKPCRLEQILKAATNS